MLYRSPLTRWFLATVGVVTGWTLTLGDREKWRDTPSLHWLAQTPVPFTHATIPLQFWGFSFFVYALLLLLPRSRPAGFTVGAILYAVFTVSLLATLFAPGPKNFVPVGAMLIVIAFHLYSIRTAYDLRDLP